MKSKVKKFLKIGIPTISIAGIVTLFVCVSGVLVKSPLVSIGGSTAVLPLINEFSKSYNNIDIVTSAGGSGAGINSIIEGTKEIGMASKTPFSPEELLNQETWKNKKVKTLTIAWDGIGIVYKPSNKKGEVININENTLAKIYTAFSGVKKLKLGELLENEDETKIIPYARNGGAEISGTADAFLKYSNLKYENSNYWETLEKEGLTEKIKNNLEKGNYGSNVIQTAESNSQTWNRVKDGPMGSMTYLSAGFIIEHQKEIESYGFKIAKYKSKNIVDENGSSNITNGYEWYRPLNLMYSIDVIKDNKDIKEMLNWMIFDGNAEKIIKDNNYTPLTIEQKESMKIIENGLESFVENWDSKLGYCGAKNNSVDEG